ncbi:hypothetical protein ACIRPX_05100 [Streptomyces sp. NPDC101225]|uniref:hypothetical protein n=1 Tax=Streptomyces sp. NPDC101225 TaxID=3366135 RepID=UPI00380FE5F3
MNRSRIPRPTETQALARAARCPRPPAPVPALFAALLTAQTAHDREGVCLLTHAIVRRGGGSR